MAHYFSLPHLGAGSPEVESLGCYFFRLARAHDCTQSQLVRHLRAWSETTHSTGPWLRLPSSLLSQTMTMCGYGSATSRITTALVDATNVQTLRSGTLLSLQHVAARTALRTLRVSRAWCPACYAEDLHGSDEPFDRLLWALVPINRCSVHGIMLLTECPTCSAPQHYTVSVKELSTCASCGLSLVGKNDCRLPATVPSYGEKLIHELIGATASNPDLTLRWESISAFYERARQELSLNHPLSVRTSFRRHGAYPTLDSLIQLATTFNVSLVDFQTFEPPALTLPLYGPDNLPAAGLRHPRRTPATHAQVEAALKEMLASHRPLPPFREFCEQLGASMGYVNYRFPALAKSYLQARRLTREAAQQRSVQAALHTLKAGGLWKAYRDGKLSQQKQVVREVSRLAAVSINVARKAVAAYEREQQPT